MNHDPAAYPADAFSVNVLAEVLRKADVMNAKDLEDIVTCEQQVLLLRKQIAEREAFSNNLRAAIAKLGTSS